MYFFKKHTKLFLISALLVITAFSACQKESDYYLESGLANPYFEGSVMDYLHAKPFYFDSVAQVANLAGMDSILANDSVTFFAPTDRSILRLVERTNDELYRLRYDTIQTLQDVPANIWRKYLSRYIFHGINKLKDYPQVDYSRRANYPGQGYISWDGTPMNIGVIYHDVNGVEYAGYRQLSIAYIRDLSDPTDNWEVAEVASCNILTNNGVVHVLSDEHTYFGFSESEFVNDMESAMGSGGVGK